MLNKKSVLAKLLANENITIVQGNFPTAMFDTKSRTLSIPNWKDMGKDVYDLLVGHEVSHALHTPVDWFNAKSHYESDDSNIPDLNIPRSMLNIIEDARIERLILEKYAGLAAPFSRGYINLMFDKDFFGIKNSDLSKLSLLDRLNIKTKGRNLIEVPFSDEELPFYKRAIVLETYDEVIKLCIDIRDYLKDKTESESESSADESSADESGADESSADESDAGDSDESGTESGTDESGTDESGTDESDAGDSDESSAGESGAGDSDDVDEFKSITDNAFRENQGELVDGDTCIVLGMNRKAYETCMVDHKELYALRMAGMAQIAYKASLVGDLDAVIDTIMSTSFPHDEFTKFNRQNKKLVNLLVKEFEMRKTAYRTLRSKTSTKGSLDVNKLHKYKYDDMLFKQINNLADGKSHGMILLVDHSSSMRTIMPSVRRQVLALVSFCKRVNIPFRVVGFTHNTDSASIYSGKRMLDNNTVQSLDHTSLKMFEMFNSSMTKKQFDFAFKILFWQSEYFSSNGYPNFGIPTSVCGESLQKVLRVEPERGYTTPLNLALLASKYIIEDFRKVNSFQKLTYVALTDGDSDSIRYHYNPTTTVPITETAGQKVIIDNGGDMIEQTQTMSMRSNTVALSKDLIKYLGKKFNATMVNYHMIDGTSVMRNRLTYIYREVVREKSSYIDSRESWAAIDNKVKRIMKKYRSDDIVVLDDLNSGYDVQFYINGLSDSMKGNIDKSGLDKLDTNATKSKLSAALTKQGNSIKSSKILTQKFAEIIA